jgi:hypothetical protein
LTTNRATGNDGGSYSFAEGDTPGFSAFLLGQTGGGPSAIGLQSFTARDAAQGAATRLFALALSGLLLACGGLFLWRRRRAR